MRRPRLSGLYETMRIESSLAAERNAVCGSSMSRVKDEGSTCTAEIGWVALERFSGEFGET